MEESLIKSYIRSFAWIGSIEPCTGVLCETCQRCLRDFLILKVHARPHHPTASSMLAAVEIGCRLCTCLWGQFAADRSIDPENVPKEMYEQQGSFSRFWAFSSRSILPIFMVRNGDMGWSPQIWILEPSAARNEIGLIDFFSYQNDLMNLMNHYWKLANGWLSECLSHHTKCKNVHGVDNYCPTRLIEVRANSPDCELRLYLKSNGSIKEPYMTLSHCWGSSQFLRLTTSTRDQLQKGFNLAELPPTFQDAIMITRNLGIKFLWIDALCIIQDSVVDWQHEAALMSQVYSNSICNVSALDAHDSTGGLFFDRETSKIPWYTLKMCRKLQRNRLYEFVNNDFWSVSVQHAPLTHRAWVLQERLLAPRVLHFGKRQLLWECNELRACEYYPRGMSATLRHSPSSDSFLKASFTNILQGGFDNTMTSSQIHGVWNELVQHYTTCNLTMSKDKLVAISGIVTRLQPLFKTDYLAGLWRDDLLEQLLWHVESSDEARGLLAGEKRPEYRAPPWSWASIDAPIVPRPRLSPVLHHMATIIEAHVTPVTEDITGQIVDGYIRLQAPLFPVKVDTSKHTRHLDLAWDWGRLESQVVTIPDVWPQSAVEALQFVPLLIDRLWAQIHGLILQPMEGNQGEYQRWGYVVVGKINDRELVNFGIQCIYTKCTYNPSEKDPEQIITLI